MVYLVLYGVGLQVVFQPIAFLFINKSRDIIRQHWWWFIIYLILFMGDHMGQD